MNNIHSSAVIEDGAKIGKNVQIGPFCVVGANVVLGDNVELKSHVVINGHTQIGDGTSIYPFASIGHAPQDLKFAGEPTELIIGKNNTIREHVTMNPGTIQGNKRTLVGDGGLFMMGSHVAHDCVVGNNVILANNATLAGHVELGDHVIIGGLSAIHQFIRVGSFAIIGGCCGVDTDVIPYGRVKDDRGYLGGLNLIGLERQGLDKTQIKQLQKAYNALFSNEGTLEERLTNIEELYGSHQMVKQIIDFARNKNKFPLCQPQRKAA